MAEDIVGLSASCSYYGMLKHAQGEAAKWNSTSCPEAIQCSVDSVEDGEELLHTGGGTAVVVAAIMVDGVVKWPMTKMRR